MQTYYNAGGATNQKDSAIAEAAAMYYTLQACATLCCNSLCYSYALGVRALHPIDIYSRLVLCC